ncbi:MAG: ATP:cob(I)alamin adenosyltransferase, partial [Acidobacteria bacterium]|nr:ATP:cob(I)alamin adenosyltransferase [Acidobacteriota bacterium]
MPRITKVYTRTGDSGETGLGGGQRVPKDSPRIAAYGTVDELNSCLGVALATGLDERVAAPLARVQNELFHLGSDLCILEEDKEAMPVPRIEAR